jgi:uncharacterized secreted protein with C-terminal beta-propeller domain
MPVRDKDFQTAPEQRIVGESGVHEFPDSTSSSSVVQRTLFMDDFVYTVSSERIKVNHLDALATDVAEVGLK